jgi:hypothetical protein
MTGRCAPAHAFADSTSFVNIADAHLAIKLFEFAVQCHAFGGVDTAKLCIANALLEILGRFFESM